MYKLVLQSSDLLLNCMVWRYKKGRRLLQDYIIFYSLHTYTHTYIHVLKSRLRWLILQYHRYLIYLISRNEATNVTQFVSRRISILSSFIIMLGQFCDCRTNLKRTNINKFQIHLWYVMKNISLPKDNTQIILKYKIILKT